MIHGDTWKYLTVLACVYKCLVYLNEVDLALENLQRLICYKPNQTKNNGLNKPVFNDKFDFKSELNYYHPFQPPPYTHPMVLNNLVVYQTNIA